MFFDSCRSVLQFLTANIDEIKFTALFVTAVTVNKYVLSELRFTVPTVFQGWQTFTCVVLLTVLLRYQKSSEEVRMLDKRTFYFLLPGFASFATGIVAGSKGLSELPVPVFCAILSLHPAILVLMDRKAGFTESSKRVCGSAAICGTIVVTLVYTWNRETAEGYLWLLGHVFLTVVYTVYMESINLNVNCTTKIYYRNLFSVAVLLPISIYLDVLSLPKIFNWRFYLGCIVSGIVGTFLQMSTGIIEKKTGYMNCQGRAKLLCSLIGHKLFFANVEPIIWFVIIINLLINSTVLSPEEKSSSSAKRLELIVGPSRRRDLYSEAAICV